MRTQRYLILALLLGLLFTSGCKHSVLDFTRTPVIEVNGNVLYQDDLEKITPPGLSAQDSLAFIEKYKKQWSIMTLLYEKAIKNIGSTHQIDIQTEAYRRDLVINQYEQQLIAEKLGDISEDSLVSLYEQEKNLFLLTEPYAKGIFIKVLKNAENQKVLEENLSNITDESLEEILRYCTQHAVQYEFLIENWEPFSKLADLMPRSIESTDPILARGTLIQAQEEYNYYLRIIGISEAGTPKPYEMIQPELRSILMNQEKIQFISRFHQELYEEAIAKDKIIFHENVKP